MSDKIYPCLWFDGQAQAAAEFYTSLFPNSKVESDNGMVVRFRIHGTPLMGLNGGPHYKATPAVSYFVYCNGDAEIERFYAALSDGGKIFMPLGKYDWSPKYAWVEDKFGVNWQLDVEDIKVAQKVVPCFLFANGNSARLKEALGHYEEVFPDFLPLMEMPYPPELGMPEGALLFAQFKVNGMVFNAMSSHEPHDFDFSPGNSVVIECRDQAELDHYWATLTKGGEESMCGWLVDKFGLSWQVVPEVLGKLMADPEKAPKAAEAFLKMRKFDLATLMEAVEG